MTQQSQPEDPTPVPAPASEQILKQVVPESPGEFEIVFGKRQVAAVLFVATVVLVVFCAASYLVGKALSPAISRADPEPVITVSAPTPTPPIPESPPAPDPTAAAPVAATITVAQPIFAEPKKGAVYIQMGAVEKGIAIIFAEGLRTHGLDAFVAAGPNDKIFRVLVGPLADPKAYDRAKHTIDQIGLTTFARKYE